MRHERMRDLRLGPGGVAARNAGTSGQMRRRESILLPMAERALECGHPHVAELLNFVAARAEEDRSGAQRVSPTDLSRTEMSDLVQDVLLDMARETCRAGEPCALPDRCLRALGEYAFTHSSHPDFHPAWLGWRLLA